MGVYGINQMNHHTLFRNKDSQNLMTDDGYTGIYKIRVS